MLSSMLHFSLLDLFFSFLFNKAFIGEFEQNIQQASGVIRQCVGGSVGDILPSVNDPSVLLQRFVLLEAAGVLLQSLPLVQIRSNSPEANGPAW